MLGLYVCPVDLPAMCCKFFVYFIRAAAFHILIIHPFTLTGNSGFSFFKVFLGGSVYMMGFSFHLGLV